MDRQTHTHSHAKEARCLGIGQLLTPVTQQASIDVAVIMLQLSGSCQLRPLATRDSQSEVASSLPCAASPSL